MVVNALVRFERGYRSATLPGPAGGRVPRTMRRFLIPLLAALVAAAATAALAVAHNDGPGRNDAQHGAYAIGLWGDLPYNDEQKTVGVPNLIADMNRQRLAFTAHDGDLKAGSGPCPDSLYTDAKATFNTLDAPAVFTPGDNDWTDCDRNPGVNSAERLDFERKVLFSTPFTLGRHRLRQEVQDAPYVENRRWSLAASPTPRSTCRGRATTSATRRPTQPSTRRATPPTSPGCTGRSPRRALAAQRP